MIVLLMIWYDVSCSNLSNGARVVSYRELKLPIVISIGDAERGAQPQQAHKTEHSKNWPPESSSHIVHWLTLNLLYDR